MIKMLQFSLRLLAGALLIGLAGCGTLEATRLQAPSATPIVSMPQASEPTPTSLPSDTPLPPSETPTPLPTATPTPPPTATLAPTATAILSPVDRLVAVRDAENGKVLFETFQERAGPGYACSNCHSVDSEEKLTGPGLLNVKARAAARVDGQSAAEYIYNSIIDTNAYLVEGFEADVMPHNWAEIYSRLEIFDIVAYLLTLEGEPKTAEPSG